MTGDKTVTATFTQIPTYSVTFTQTGLPTGTNWTVTFNSTAKSSITNTISFTGYVNGVYSYSIVNPSGYVSDVSSGTVTVANANANQDVTFG